MVQKHIVISMIAPVAVAGILIMTILAATVNAQESNSTENLQQESNSTENVQESSNAGNATSPSESMASNTGNEQQESNNTGNATSTGAVENVTSPSGSMENTTSGMESNNTGNAQESKMTAAAPNIGNARQESNNTGNATSTGAVENATSPSGSTANNATSTGVPYNATSTGVPENMKNSNNETAADFANNILAVHNRERAAVGVPLLVWSDKLAADAKTWADHMTVTREYVHCGATPGCDTHGEGENMEAATFGDTNTYGNTPSTAKLQHGWVNEKNYYQQWVTNSLPRTANWTGWYPGHYNQMVWNTTKQVGCATGFTPPGFLHGVYLVCRYSPPGNYPGQKPY